MTSLASSQQSINSPGVSGSPRPSRSGSRSSRKRTTAASWWPGSAAPTPPCSMETVVMNFSVPSMSRVRSRSPGSDSGPFVVMISPVGLLGSSVGTVGAARGQFTTESWARGLGRRCGSTGSPRTDKLGFGRRFDDLLGASRGNNVDHAERIESGTCLWGDPSTSSEPALRSSKG